MIINLYDCIEKKRLGIFIMSSHQDLFNTNTSLLKEYYHNVIINNGFNADVYSFVGDETCESTYENGDTIHCKCSDRYIGDKIECVFNYVKTNKRYDYLIFTNASTFVNLKMIYNNLDSLNPFNFYYMISIPYNLVNGKEGFYANGNFKLFSFRILEKICSYYSHKKVILSQSFNMIEEKDDENSWLGMPEDIIIDFCLKENNIPIIQVGNTIMLFDYHTNFLKSNSGSMKFKDVPIIQFKAFLHPHDRLLVEPNIIKQITTEIGI